MISLVPCMRAPRAARKARAGEGWSQLTARWLALAGCLLALPAWLYYVEVGRHGPLYPTDSEIWMPMEGNLTYISFANDFGPVNLSKLYRFCMTLSRVMEVPASRAAATGPSAGSPRAHGPPASRPRAVFERPRSRPSNEGRSTG